jgi:hypothetical protein
MRRVIPFVMLLALAAASNAFGDQVGTANLRLDNAYGDNVTVNYPVSHSESTVAGPYGYYISGAVGLNGHLAIPTGTYNGFCIDLVHNISFGQTANYDVWQLNQGIGEANNLGLAPGTVKLHNVLALFQDYVNAGGNMINPQATASTNKILTDALSIALWEVMNETAGSSPYFNVNNGNVYVNWTADGHGTTQQAAAAKANDWLSTLSLSLKSSDAEYGGAMYAFYNGSVQGQEITLAGFLSQVPEPDALVRCASLLFAALPIVALSLWRRRKA